MTKGELILSCLKLCFDIDDYSLDETTGNITSENSDLQSRITNIPYSVDRALNEVAKNGKLPIKAIEDIDAYSQIPYTRVNEIPTEHLDEYIRCGDFMYKWDGEKYEKEPLTSTFDYTLPKDVYRIKKIEWIYDDGYDFHTEKIGIQFKGSTKIVLPKKDCGKYLITYSPHYVGSVSTLRDEEEITNGNEVIPDYIMRIIPYYVKGDIYEEDGINEAVYARNLFNSLLNDLETVDSNHTQIKIIPKYEMW